MRFLAASRLLAACGMALPLALPSCATYENDLARGHHAFEESDHEQALAILRHLEPDVGRLTVSDRGRYAYLRGMADYRIGYKADARHWLAIAAAIEQQAPGSLGEDWTKRMNEALKELNEEVFSAGIGALSNSASPGSGAAAGDDGQTPPAPPANPPEKKGDPSNTGQQ